MRKSFLLPVAAVCALSSCAQMQTASSSGGTARPAPQSANPAPRVTSIQLGKASWYSIRCNGGTRTASGERLCDQSLTAAHKHLPMGTKVRVTNEKNGRSVVVRINDRGPYIRGRIIDVSKGAASELGMMQSGVVPVKVEVLESGPESQS